MTIEYPTPYRCCARPYSVKFETFDGRWICLRCISEVVSYAAVLTRKRRVGHD